MIKAKLSDAEVHDLVIQSIKSMTREEWQTRLDAAAAAFDRQEADETGVAHKGSRVKSAKATKTSTPRPVAEVVAG